MARKDEDQGAISFNPETFSTGRWSGGRGTVVADPPPHFEYRSAKGKNGEFTVIEAHFGIEDREGVVQRVRWMTAFADDVVIRESNDPDSDEAEQGPSIFARTPGKKIKLRADTEWGQLNASLQVAGFPTVKLNKGDLNEFIGLDADWVEFHKTKDDKYPFLIIGELFDGKSKSKSSTVAGKSKTTKAVKDDEDDEDEKPTAKKGKGEPDAEEVALEIALEALKDADDPTTEGTTVGDVVRLANKKLKADPAMKKLVLDLVGGDPAEKGSWITSQSEFKYKKKTNSIVLVEED